VLYDSKNLEDKTNNLFSKLDKTARISTYLIPAIGFYCSIRDHINQKNPIEDYMLLLTPYQIMVTLKTAQYFSQYFNSMINLFK